MNTLSEPTKKWGIAPAISPEAQSELSSFHPIIAQILFNRGKTTRAEAEAFIKAVPPQDTDPFLLLGMDKAVDRILAAIHSRESIAVYGDYDADGVTATALLIQTLEMLEANVRPYIPNRFDEGYGLNKEALDTLKNEGVKVVISVDCGIRSIEEAAHARKINLDLIITDHHQPGNEIPDAVAVINAKQPGDSYPDKNLAGVGTAYKLACAIMEQFPGFLFDPSNDISDLVALGTVADLVPLDGENRALVRSGLDRIRDPQRPGLVSLMGVAGVTPAQVTAMHIGFFLGPRLNAAGRLDSAMAAYHLLTSKSLHEAGLLAQKLDNQNRERQAMTRSMQEQAEALAFPDGSVPFLIFAGDPSFNEGVLGLAASRLSEKFYRPAIVANLGEEFVRASCRSIPEFPITRALDTCADLLEKYGGHDAAAGFTVSRKNLPALLDRLQTLAATLLADLDLRPKIRADAEVPLAALDFTLLKELEKLEPTGFGNEKPVFITRNARVNGSQLVGRDRSHLKFGLTDGKKFLNAIAFRQGHRYPLPMYVDVLYHFESNEYNGLISPQLNIIDFQEAGKLNL